jgi:phosphoribosyl 1,2-cyclic phosphodiesterase
MRVCTIGSGSSGNCVYVGSGETHLLIDAGISGKRIEQGLNEIGLSTKDIDAVLVTHEHTDHIQGLGVISRRAGLPIYTAERTYDEIVRCGKAGKIPEGLFNKISADETFSIGDIDIHSFSTSHDAADPLGFRFESGGHSFAVATDLGCYNDYIIRQLEKLDGILIESNHDVRMLEAGAYPYFLKQRILSDTGHLSNEEAGHLLENILHGGLKNIILGHLSKENNYPLLALQTVCSEIDSGETPYSSGDFRIEIAKRDMPGALIEW